jgi:hypothetical protein
MSDDDEGFIIGGPLEPDDLPEPIRKMMEHLEKRKAAKVDRDQMEVEVQALATRHLLEALDDDQLETFQTLLGLLASEGRDNYLTATIYGMALAVGWSREKLPDEG